MRWRGKPVVRNEETPARQTPVAHHQILHALSSPSPSTLSWEALPREPLCYLRQRLADLMIEHNVGVRVSRALEFKRLDEDFFAEDD